jgi:hypothetical protein
MLCPDFFWSLIHQNIVDEVNKCLRTDLNCLKEEKDSYGRSNQKVGRVDVNLKCFIKLLMILNPCPHLINSVSIENTKIHNL